MGLRQATGLLVVTARREQRAAALALKQAWGCDGLRRQLFKQKERLVSELLRGRGLLEAGQLLRLGLACQLGELRLLHVAH